MKYIILIFILAFNLIAGVVKSPLVSVDLDSSAATIEIDKIDIGMSGFIVQNISQNHTTILKSIVVTHYDSESKVATLKLSEYDALVNNALPSGKWSVKVGDTAVLAFGYTRGFLVAPSDEIYNKITRSVKNLQWVHPDIFATLLSFSGHPTPLREDFTKFSILSSVGLVFVYLDKKLFTLDAKSFKILTISDANLEQKDIKLPFYTRVDEIEASWWGEGSSELDEYEPHYYELLSEANPNNEELKKLINNFNTKGEE